MNKSSVTKINILVILMFATIFLSCKKGNKEELSAPNIKTSVLSNGLPNITGLFNAYRYQEDMSGYVALEVMDIKYTEANQEIVATKLLGDEAVPAGKMTFKGFYINTYFKLTMLGWNPQTQQYIEDEGANLVVDDENSFTIYLPTTSYLKFFRRVDK